MKYTDLATKFIQQYVELSKSTSKQDQIRGKYYKAAGATIAHKRGEVTIEGLKALGLTDRMIKHAEEFMNEKTRTRSRSKSSDNIKNDLLYQKLISIKGIGPTKAYELIRLGVFDVKQLHFPVYYNTLSQETKLFLRYEPSTLNKKIADELIKMLHTIAKKIGIKIQVSGSYRRGVTVMNDIDILVYGDMKEYSNAVINSLSTIVYQNGTEKMAMLINYGKYSYKVDFFNVNPGEEIPMLLYTTGSKDMNIIMRMTAKKKGLILNQHGLFDGTRKIKLATEEDYFKYLGLEYKSPSNR